MKKLWMAGALVLSVAVLLCFVPQVPAAGATTSDFIMEGTTLVSYTGTATTVSVPSTVEKIGRSAFEENDNIKKITIPDSVTAIEEYAFWGCEGLEKVVLGEGLKEVSDFAFTACTGLKNVSIPDNIGRIGIMAFADCTSLEEIYIPVSVTDIHETAFDGAPNLQIRAKEYSYPYRYAQERNEKLANELYDPMATEVPMVTTPPPTPIPIPTPEPTNRPIGEVIGTTTIVGNQAVVFMDWEELEVSYGEDIDIEDFRAELEKRKVVKDWTYYGDKSLHYMELPTGTLELGSFAFARSNVRSVKLPHGLTTIGYAAFYHCDNLTEVQIPGTVTKIEAKAFTYTPWLENFFAGTSETTGSSDFLIVGDGVLLAYRGDAANVIIPEGVKYIAAEAFLKHTEIESVQFPSTLEAVDAKAFEGCTYNPAY